MGGSPDTPALWDFAAFEPGQDLGTRTLSIDCDRLQLWSEVFDLVPDGDEVPVSVLVSVMMEGYLRVAQPRPEGNIHAGQRLRLMGRRPRLGEALAVTLGVARKEERKGRKWLTFDSAIRSGEETLLAGEILTIWAA